MFVYMYTYICVDIFWNDIQDMVIIVTLETGGGRGRGSSFSLDTFLYYLTCLQKLLMPLNNKI